MNKVAEIARDVFGLIGTALVSYGSWLVYEPSGFIVAGLILLSVSMIRMRGS